jgi:photosystem II stability/assembly factor-like uncharacterized protein
VSSDRIADVCRRWKVAELSLFGSVMRDDFRPDSHIDVLVRFLPDAGFTWTALPPSPLWRTSDIVRIDALHAWVIGSGGSSPSDYAMVATTADGGQTWTLQVNQANGFKPLAAGVFSDGNHGSAVGRRVTVGPHCFGCTAGAGSSCGGATA